MVSYKRQRPLAFGIRIVFITRERWMRVHHVLRLGSSVRWSRSPQRSRAIADPGNRNAARPARENGPRASELQRRRFGYLRGGTIIPLAETLNVAVVPSGALALYSIVA